MDVEGGLLLSQALARHLNIFSRLYVAMVEAGEAAGVLDVVLDRVAFQIEKDTKIRRCVRGAMMYPLMVMSFATLVLIGMLMFLVLVFVNIFQQLGGDLPTLTKIVLTMSNILKGYFYIIFPVWGGLIFGLPLQEDAARQAHGTSSASSLCRIGKSSSRSGWRAFRARSPRSSRPASTSSAARDHRTDLGQQPHRRGDAARSRARAPGRPDRRAARGEPDLPADGGAHGARRRGNRW